MSIWWLRTAHTTPEKFENAALFLQKSLPSTLIRHENGASQKRSSNRGNLKMSAWRFRVDGKHFGNRAFRKRWRHLNHASKFLRRSVDGKHLVRFQSETSIFKFLRQSMDGAFENLISRCSYMYYNFFSAISYFWKAWLPALDNSPRLPPPPASI